MRFFVSGWMLLVTGLLCSCSSYKQNIMFKTSDGFQPNKITEEAKTAEKNYIIQQNDYLKLEIYSNGGEKLIDPNPELSNQAIGQNTMPSKSTR